MASYAPRSTGYPTPELTNVRNVAPMSRKDRLSQQNREDLERCGCATARPATRTRRLVRRIGRTLASERAFRVLAEPARTRRGSEREI